MNIRSEFVGVVSDLGHFDLHALSLADAEDEILSLLVNEWEALDLFPVVEDILGEGLALSVSSQHAGEAERFGDGKIGFDLNRWKGTKLRGVPAIWISSMTMPRR